MDCGEGESRVIVEGVVAFLHQATTTRERGGRQQTENPETHRTPRHKGQGAPHTQTPKPGPWSLPRAPPKLRDNFRIIPIPPPQPPILPPRHHHRTIRADPHAVHEIRKPRERPRLAPILLHEPHPPVPRS